MAITYAKEASAASAVVKAIELSGGKAVAIRATLPTPKQSRMRSNRSSRPSADSMCL